MIVLDTHVLIHDALQPRRLSSRARRAIERPTEPLAVSDISLWEIAMLIAKGRIDPGVDAAQFIDDVLAARAIQVLPITPQIAVLAQAAQLGGADPADRLIAATTIVHGARLVTADALLRRVASLHTLW